MRSLIPGTIGLLLAVSTEVAAAADPPADTRPLIRLQADGPLGYTTSMAFRKDADDGQIVLHAAGIDKVIHAWSQPRESAVWRYDRSRCLRVPIAPGVFGSLNAVAVSPDGVWMAAAGRGTVRGLSTWDESGFIQPAADLTPEMREDMGTILVFHLPTGKVRRLRGHAGSVLSLCFAPGSVPILVSAAVEMSREIRGSLRVWDVAGSRELKSLSVQVPDSNLRPGLTAWRIGAQPEAIRVAVAWGDRKLRFWDVAAGALGEPAVGDFAVTALTLPGTPSRLLAGMAGQGGAAGRAGIWTLPIEADGRMGRLSLADNFRNHAAAPISPHSLPTGVTVIPGDPQLGDLAAWTIFEQKEKPYYHWLMVVRLATGRVEAKLPLWNEFLLPPAIAADPTGRFLAVAGGDQHEIWMYRVQELLKGSREKQVLRSVAQMVRHVSFAQREQKLGLVLGGTPSSASPRAERQLFDVAQRRITTVQGWTPFNADQAQWQVTTAAAQPDRRLRLSVRRGSQQLPAIELETGEELTAWALTPNSPYYTGPLLAVAVQSSGEPKLLLYDPDTAQLLCQLNGHSEPIESIGFSQDGKHLGSVSFDNTICLWWLADLQESLQARGAWRGLGVTANADGQLVVTKDRPGRFNPGDVLSVVDRSRGSEPIKFKSAWEFHCYLAELKPGSQLTIDVNRAGARNVTVGSAIPERKPLCSVYLFQEPADGSRQWISWDPLGRYDASGAEAERRLGWHFNTDDPESPVKFAVVEKYREQNRWPGLLADHLEQGPVLSPRAVPPPEMSLLLREGQRPLMASPGEPSIARTADVTALVRVSKFPERLISEATWRIGAAEGRLQRVSEGLWKADLSQANMTRKVDTLKLAVRTNELPPRDFTREATLRVVPPPPEIDVRPEIPATVNEEPLEFSVLVQSGVFQHGEPVSMELVHSHEGRPVADTKWEAEAGQAKLQKVQLRPGNNVLTVTARHARALADTQALEETRKSWAIRLSAPQRPQIQLVGIVPGNAKEAVRVDPAAALPTEAPTIEIRGRITVAPPDVLNRAAYVNSEVNRDTALTGFAKQSAFDFKQSVTLVPGMQTITLTTETNRGATERLPFRVNFSPALPVVERIDLAHAGGSAWPYDDRLIAGRDDRRVTAEIRLAPPPAGTLFPHDAELVLRVKSADPLEPQIIPIKVQSEPQTIRRALTLNPGVNEIFVSLQNRWGNSRTLAPRRLEYLQPPRILQVTLPAQSDAASVLLEAEVESESELTRVAVLAGGLEVPVDTIGISPSPEARTRWKVHARVPLDVTRKRTAIELSVWNQDGETLERYRGTTTYTPPPPPVPDVRVDNLIQTAAKQLLVQCRVRSKSALDKVIASISQNGRKIHEKPVTIAVNATPDASGYVEASHEWPLDEIGAGKFEVTIEAQNEHGPGKSTVHHSYQPEPLRLVVHRLRPVGAADGLASRGSSTRRFDPAPHGNLELEGFLDHVPTVKHPLVKIWVNGFLQSIAPLETVDGRARFSARIALNVSKENKITFELPHQPEDEQGMPTLYVDCDSHLRPPKMHLLTVVADDNLLRGQDATAVRNLHLRIQDALGHRTGRAIEDFEVIPYPQGGSTPGVLTEFETTVFRGYLEFIADEMINQASRLGAGQPFNEVLVIYYAGTAVVKSGSELELRTGDPNSMISLDSTAEFLREMPGAHLLLLDIEHTGAPFPATVWKPSPYLGVLRVISQRDTRGGTQPEKFVLVSALENLSKRESDRELTLKQADPLLDREIKRMGNPGVLYEPEIPDDLQEVVLKR